MLTIRQVGTKRRSQEIGGGEISHIREWSREGASVQLSFAFTVSLRALPSTRSLASLAWAALITRPICLAVVAAVSAIACNLK